MNVGLIRVEGTMAMDEVEKAITALVGGLRAPPVSPEVDPGVDNIQRAGELSAKAYMDSMEEAAKRCEAAGQVSLEMGQARKEAADLLAKDLRERGRLFADGIVQEFTKGQSVAESQASIRRLVLGDVPEQPKTNGAVGGATDNPSPSWKAGIRAR